jgi:ribosome-associated heat shock protein Hsp15
MAGEQRQRIDKWLFFARVVKSRSLAAKLVQAGRVRVNREKAGEAAQPVKPGDVLTINLDRRVIVLRIVAAGVRRGPFEEAKTLYADLTPQPVSGEAPPPDAVAPLREAGSGRPTKKERREMQKFRDGD